MGNDCDIHVNGSFCDWTWDQEGEESLLRILKKEWREGREILDQGKKKIILEGILISLV